MKRSRNAATCVLVGLLLWLTACAHPDVPARRTVELRGPTMGTSYSVKVVLGSTGDARAADLDRRIRSDLARISALMSTWDADSELSRFNRFRGSGPFPVSRETFEVLQWARKIGALTGGALDVTLAPLIDAWGFGPAGPRDHPPSEVDIARLREAVGLHLLELDEGTSTIRKKRPDLRCDLSALVPGYAADRLATMLLDHDIGDFLVDVGGELRAHGRNKAGRPWQIGIERPAEDLTIQRTISLVDSAITTSGDYRNAYELNGVRVAHILDPRTGRPISNRLASVTVIDRLAVRADGLSTALMVLGPDEGLAVAERLDLAALFLIRSDGGTLVERATTRFAALASAPYHHP